MNQRSLDSNCIYLNGGYIVMSVVIFAYLKIYHMSQMLKNTAYDIQVNHLRDVERVSTSLLSSQN